MLCVVTLNFAMLSVVALGILSGKVYLIFTFLLFIILCFRAEATLIEKFLT